MIEVHLYGKLRRFAPNKETAGDSIVLIDAARASTVSGVLSEIGITPDEVSNIFVNGELSAPGRAVADGDRVGVFPEDMALLYKWYFQKKE